MLQDTDSSGESDGDDPGALFSGRRQKLKNSKSSSVQSPQVGRTSSPWQSPASQVARSISTQSPLVAKARSRDPSASFGSRDLSASFGSDSGIKPLPSSIVDAHDSDSELHGSLNSSSLHPHRGVESDSEGSKRSRSVSPQGRDVEDYVVVSKGTFLSNAQFFLSCSL